MDLATLCTLVASLRVEPNRTQFFQYEKVSLSCGSDWSVMRNTSLHMNQRSPQQNKSSWSFNQNIYYRDAGVYWCQSEEGQCGAVNITVTVGGVILESPVLPVLEGETVTLRCIINPRNKPVSEGTFRFYRDGSLVGNSSSGELTLSSVSESDSGLFSCGHEEELSMESPLVVLNAESPTIAVPFPPQPMKIPLYRLLCFAFLFLFYTVVLCTGLYKWARAQGEEKKLKSKRRSRRRIRHP